MTLWYLVFVSTLVNLYKDSAGTVCSDAVTDGTTVLNMCEGGNAVGDHVVIDTYGSSVYRKDGGSINCSCTTTLTGLPDGTMTSVGFGSAQSLYPPSGCGSSVVISTQQAVFLSVSSNTYICTVLNNTFNFVQTKDTVTVVWQSGVSGSISGYCLSLRAGQGSSLSTNCFAIFSSMETTIASQSRTTATQSKETTTQSREKTTQSKDTTTTTKSKMTTTHSRETTTYNSTNSGSTTLGQTNWSKQNDLPQCYPLSAVVVPLVVTSLLIIVTVVVHFILYRKRLAALVKQPEYTEAVMTSPNPVNYDSLDISRVEPPNLYADTSTGQMYVNAAMES